MSTILFTGIISILILLGIILLISIFSINELNNLSSTQKNSLFIISACLIVLPSILFSMYYSDTKQLKIYADNITKATQKFDDIVDKAVYEDLKTNKYTQLYNIYRPKKTFENKIPN